MKRLFFLFMSVFTLTAAMSLTGCEVEVGGEGPVEDAVEDVADAIEDAGE